IERGHMLAIAKPSRLIKDKISDEEVMLPQQKVGKLLVYKVFEQVSYALVTKAEKPINQFDIVTVP
ncbi:peptidoglycan-binding protein, partial [Thiotrichales bacterium HSG1]|nr:peptidoglycan-binding protein [Thiotrichales bacterium HSG1]